MVDVDVDRVIEQERALLRPSVRASRSQVGDMLHPDFSEFGASGRRWDRAAMLDLLAGEDPGGDPVVASDVAGVRLDDNVVLVTYVSERGERRSRRSSVWRRAADGNWRLYFHQGTPL